MITGLYNMKLRAIIRRRFIDIINKEETLCQM